MFNTLTSSIRIYGKEGEVINNRSVLPSKLYVSQYRSRTMSKEETIRDAFAYTVSVDDIRMEVYTKAAATNDDESTTVLTSMLDNVLEKEDRTTINVLNVARNKDYREKAITIATEKGYVPVTINTANPLAKVSALVDEKDNMLVILEMMYNKLWFELASYYIKNEKISSAWATGNGDVIRKVLKTNNKRELSEELTQKMGKISDYMLEKMNDNSEMVNRLADLRAKFEAKTRELENLQANIRTVEKDIIYAKVTKNEQVKELETALKNLYKAKSLTTFDINSGILSLEVTTPLEYYDKESYKILRNSTRHNALSSVSEDNKKLFDAIFLTGEVKLILSNSVDLSLTYGSIVVKAKSDYAAYPNPHHKWFNCWGDYTRPITDNVLDYHWDTALHLITIATAGINVEDSPVMTKLVYDLLGEYWSKDILLYEGQMISPKEFVRKETIYG